MRPTRGHPLVSLRAALLLLSCAPLLASAPGYAKGDVDPLLVEVIMSLHASAVEPPSLEALARAGLAAVHEKHACLRVLRREGQVRVVCEGEAVTSTWPPDDGREVATLLSETVALVGARGKAKARLSQWVARSVAGALGDPYTAYLPPETVAKLETHLRSRLATTGLELSPKAPDRVREVRPGSDAAREGLREGDRIVAIDHHAASALTYAELNALLVGPTGSTVRLDYVPHADPRGAKRTVILSRSILPDQTVEAERLPGGALYVRVGSFAPGVARRVAEEIWDRGRPPVVLDLRHNQGGLIQEGVALLDLFFGEGNIGGVAPRRGRPADDFRAAHQPTDVDVPLVVLVDGGSASASELVAMVLKERGRAVVLGSPSLGKGSVQKVIRMPDGGVLRVTSAYYTGPKGNPLGIGGVRPDFFLSPPVGRTVLEGGSAAKDSWVLSALDVLEGKQRVTQEAGALFFGPAP